MRRTFISLQGVASPFFSELNQQLRQLGHSTHRINFCGGDLLFSLFESHSNFTGKLSHLRSWLTTEMTQRGATDILLFGDCRPVHREAIAAAKGLNIRVYVFEEGYLRPDWITLELGVVNGYSGMALEPSVIASWANRQPTPGSATPAPQSSSYMLIRAVNDIAYRLASTATGWLFPSYQTHRPHNGAMEYAGLARRFGMGWWFAREAKLVTTKLLTAKSPYFLFTLQLNADSQIKTHSPFPNVIASIEKVLTSFKNADFQQEALPVSLLIKNHPLDTGLARYRSYVERRSRELNLGDRVKFIEAGDLPLLVTHAQGVVLVNSTVGLTALALGCPVHAMGKAIFNQANLTDQGDLASFWCAPTPPNADFFKLFVAYIKAHSQIAGDFYSRAGRKRAALDSLQTLLKASL